jgi:site-specific DNA-methyltransferase (adenine-specific)
MPDCSVDAVVTDPPYGLSFMGKKWDYDVPGVEVWAECLRVLKPGGHLLAFAGTRTQHRMAVRIEDAGFEIRDMIAWVYGSGFPKSLNLKDEWQGWGTALKPALEPITVARKPLIGTVAENVLQHGTGAINVDGGRVGKREKEQFIGAKNGTVNSYGNYFYEKSETPLPPGRWPANFIHDGSEEVMGLFPMTTSGGGDKTNKDIRGEDVGGLYGTYKPNPNPKNHTPNFGSAARFFYCAKASKRDRDEGNNHPTVKPTDLMRYLCRLVTPPDGLVLDPFMGSGSTGKAAALEGFSFIGIEREAEYVAIAQARINHVTND